MGSKQTTKAYLDTNTNSVIKLDDQANAATAFGSKQTRYNLEEKLAKKVPNKVGPGSYDKVTFESKQKNFSTRFL